MSSEVRDEMFAHALAGLPHEACGMFSVSPTDDVVDRFHPMHNAAASAKLFELDGKEMLDLERHIDDTHRQLVGVMHSHIDTSPYPSPTDVRDIDRFDPAGVFDHIIVSLRHAEPVLRCYAISAGAITEVPVVITDGDDLRDGEAIQVASVISLPKPQ